MNNIFAFHGGDTKVGTTMISQSVAQRISQNRPKDDVLYISLSSKENSEFLSKNYISIDALKNKLDAGINIKKSNIRNCEEQDNLFILKGVIDEIKGRYYTPQIAIQLISDLFSQFHVIIIDTGSSLDSGLALGGLSIATKKYLILSQNEACIARFEKGREIYENMKISFDKVILNKYLEIDPYDAAYIAKRLKISKENVMNIALSNKSRKAEMQQKTIYEYMENKYIKGISRIEDDIKNYIGIKTEKERRFKWINSIWKNI